MFFFFFFKRKTAYEMRISDWSSDVCSSDLARRSEPLRPQTRPSPPPERHSMMAPGRRCPWRNARQRSEEHTSELQSLMRISYAVFCLKKKKRPKTTMRPHKHFHPRQIQQRHRSQIASSNDHTQSPTN